MLIRRQVLAGVERYAAMVLHPADSVSTVLRNNGFCALSESGTGVYYQV